MADLEAYIVDEVLSYGASDDGEFVILVIKLEGGDKVGLAFPMQQAGDAIGKMMMGAGEIVRQKTVQLGSETGVLDAGEYPSLTPSGHTIYGRTGIKGEQIVSIGMMADRIPLMHVDLPAKHAERLAEDIERHLAIGPLPAPKKH